MKTRNSRGPFRVVGIRANGERIVISSHLSREAAERVVRLIQHGGGYDKLKIETGTERQGVPCQTN